jgi:hypothetical protein
MLRDRLVYGCGRLTGGATTKESMALVGICLDNGVHHFDTAPSYGMGTAEVVLGQAIAGYSGPLAITAKIGSPRDPQGLVKTYARAIKRMMSSGNPRPVVPAPLPGPSFAADRPFRRAALRESLERTLRALGRPADLLLLHETPPPARFDDAVDVLQDALLAGQAAAIGYSHGGAFSDAVDRLYDPSYAAQIAMSPGELSGHGKPARRHDLLLHSLVKVGRYLEHTQPVFAEALTAASDMLPHAEADVETRKVAALLALASARAPEARLIFSSNHRRRLQALFHCIRVIEDERLVEATRATFEKAGAAPV